MTHMDELKPFDSKSVTYTYIGYSEHNLRGQPIVRRANLFSVLSDLYLDQMPKKIESIYFSIEF